MKLDRFLSLLVFATGAALIALVYIESTVIVGGGIRLIEEAQIRAIRSFSKVVLDTEIHQMDQFGREIGQSNEVGKIVLMNASASDSSVLIKKAGRWFSKQHCLDPELHGLNNFSAERSQYPISQEEQALVTSGSSIHTIMNGSGSILLVSYFPIRLYRDVVGLGICQVDLGQRIKKFFAEETKTTLTLVNASDVVDSTKSIEIEHSRALGRGLMRVESNFVGRAGTGIEFTSVFIGLGVVGLLILAMFWVLRVYFLSGFKSAVGQIDGLVEDLQLDRVTVLSEKPSSIVELSYLSKSAALLSSRLVDFKKRISEKSRAEAIGEKASQVAHDMKSPLAALEMAVLSDGAMKESRKTAIQTIIRRIHSIAADVDSKNASLGESGLDTSETARTDINLLSETVIAEKAFQYLSKQDVSIRLVSSGVPIFSLINRVELQRVLSNLIDNSVEALGNRGGKVEVRLSEVESNVVIEVCDTGVGIPKQVLSKLGRKGNSFGKKNGQGLGLSHAIAFVQGVGGKFDVDSRPEFKTVVRIALKRSEPPVWSVTELAVWPNQKIVIVDDNSSIHLAWKERFESLPGFEKLGLELVFISRAEELLSWVHHFGGVGSDVLVLCDYELGNRDWNGLDLLSQLRLSNSVLVTGHEQNERIRNECESLHVKLLDKRRIRRIPIHIFRSRKSSPQRQRK